jgi:ParB family transcriptional regulator, chromosome partitioning protein
VSRRDRLGRGLGALIRDHIGEDADAEGHSPPARAVRVAAIVPNPFQPRREFAEEELADLAASMQANGLLQPVVVRPAPGGVPGRWELIAGERRWRASMRLGWTEIPAAVRHVDDRTMLVLALVENVQRAELSPLEEAEAFQRLGDEFSLSHQEIADLVGRDRSTISNALRLLQLPASVRAMVAAGSLSAGHARALLGLGSEHLMADLGRQAASEGWSVREVENRVQRARPASKGAGGLPGREGDAAERMLEEELQRRFGTAVRIRSGRGMKGRIEIPFHGAEDFERIYELVAGRPAGDVVS